MVPTKRKGLGKEERVWDEGEKNDEGEVKAYMPLTNKPPLEDVTKEE